MGGTLFFKTLLIKYLCMTMGGLLICMLTTAPALAQKTDVIFLKNGDRVTGEIEELDRGLLQLSTTAFGKIQVNWVDIERMESDKHLQVEKGRGDRYLGSVTRDTRPGVLALIQSGQPVQIDLGEVVRLEPIKTTERLWSRLEKRLNIGFTHTQASEVTQWNINATLRYRAPKYEASASYDSMIILNQADEDRERRDLTGTYLRLRPERWVWFGTSSLQEDDELGVDGRLLVSAGVGRFLLQSSRQELSLRTGLSGNWENSIGDENENSDLNTSVDGVLGVNWSFYKLHSPLSDLGVSLEYYPGLSETGRHRGNANIRYRQEFVQDLYWNLRYYYAYDSQPPAGSRSDDDFGIVTGIEYKF